MNEIIVYKDKFLLEWDGSLPPNVKESAVHSPEDVPYVWPHLRGHARYSQRSGKYVLNFSAQNIYRLMAQFDDNLDFKKAENNPAYLELLDHAEKIKGYQRLALACKNAPIEKLPKYDYKVPPLGEWQHREVVYLVNLPIAPLFADCGTGKTFAVLTSTEQQIKKGVLKRGKTLVAAKLATLETGWLEDAEKFTDLKVSVLWEASAYKKKEKILEKMREDADVFVINHDGVRVYEEELSAMNFEKIVVDESTILKGFRGMDPRTKGGAFGKALHRISHCAKYRVIMSGTPAPNGPVDLWGQFTFLDPAGILLEPNFRDFEAEYYETIDLRPSYQRFVFNSDGSPALTPDGKKIPKPLGPRSPRKMVPRDGALKDINGIIDPLAFRVKLRDHVNDFPELTIMKRFVHMSSEQKKHYKDMKERLKVEINDERITVPIALAKMMKLRQITGGFIIDNNEQAHEILASPKIFEFESIVNDEIDREEKIVVYAQYRWEIEEITRRYKDQGVVSVYGGNSSRVNLDNIKAFREDPKIRMIVLHPKSAAHGITFTMARYMIFYSISHSAEDNYQCIKRIERAGQKNAMFVFYLLCKQSIDDDIYLILNMKDRMQEQILDGQNQIDNQLIANWRSE